MFSPYGHHLPYRHHPKKNCVKFGIGLGPRHSWHNSAQHFNRQLSKCWAQWEFKSSVSAQRSVSVERNECNNLWGRPGKNERSHWHRTQSVCPPSLIFKFHSLFGSQRHRDPSVFSRQRIWISLSRPGKNERCLLHRTQSICPSLIFKFHSLFGSQSHRDLSGFTATGFDFLKAGREKMSALTDTGHRLSVLHV